MKIILASKSPRRKELFSRYTEERGLEFEIITREVDEDMGDVTVERGVEELAVKKGRAVAQEYPNALVVSSDTLVELDGVPLGKPADENEAVKMLRSLSGRAHNVHTGIAIHYKNRVFSGVATTAVVFRELTDTEILEYVSSGEPMDKAGAYGIQGAAGKFVSEYRGEFDTVVGFNITLLDKLMSAAIAE